MTCTDDYIILKTDQGQTILFKEPHRCAVCHAMTAWFHCGKEGRNTCWRCAKRSDHDG